MGCAPWLLARVILKSSSAATVTSVELYEANGSTVHRQFEKRCGQSGHQTGDRDRESKPEITET